MSTTDNKKPTTTDTTEETLVQGDDGRWYSKDDPRLGRFLANQSIGFNPGYDRFNRNRSSYPYGSDPRLGNQYYNMTTRPMTNKQMGQVAGLGLLTAGLERAIKAQEASSTGAKYAESELAKAKADSIAKDPVVTKAEMDRIRQESMLPIDTAITEAKLDTQAFVASKGGTVKDLIATEEIGIQAKADAALEGEAIIAQKELQNFQKGEAKREAAKRRTDELVAITDKKQMEQLKYTADLVGDVAKVAATTMAHSAAKSQQPAIDQLSEKGATWEEIEQLHDAAVKAQFRPGTRGYEHFILAHYKGGDADKPTDKTPDVSLKSTDLSRKTVPFDVSQYEPRGTSSAQLEAATAVREQDKLNKKKAVSSSENAVTRLKAIGGQGALSASQEDTIRSLGQQLASFATTSVVQTDSGRFVNVGDADPSTGQPMLNQETPPPRSMTEEQRQILINEGLLPGSETPTTPMTAMEQFMALPKSEQDRIMAILNAGKAP